MRRIIIGFVMLLFAVVSAEAVTLRDIIDLTKAGLGDDVLLALIEVDGRVFDVDSVTLSRLKAAGVSEKVIVALVRSGRVPPPVPASEPTIDVPRSLSEVVAAQQAPQVIYIEQPPATVVREVAVPYPVYVGIPVSSRGRHGRPVSNPSDGVQPSITAPPLLQGERRYLTDIPPEPKSQEPVYWGWGGKLRPDAWKPKQ